jgi:hypothetical protein
VKHDADYETEEREDMLDDKEFIPKIANWGEGAKVHPHQEGECFDPFQD